MNSAGPISNPARSNQFQFSIAYAFYWTFAIQNLDTYSNILAESRYLGECMRRHTLDPISNSSRPPTTAMLYQHMSESRLVLPFGTFYRHDAGYNRFKRP